MQIWSHKHGVAIIVAVLHHPSEKHWVLLPGYLLSSGLISVGRTLTYSKREKGLTCREHDMGKLRQDKEAPWLWQRWGVVTSPGTKGVRYDCWTLRSYTMLLMYQAKEKAWEPRDSAIVIFLGLKKSRRSENKPEKQVGDVQHRATVLDKHIFPAPSPKVHFEICLSPNMFILISWELTSCQEPASKYTSSALEDQILILDGIKQPAVHLSSSTSSKITSLVGRWGEKVWIDLWDLGNFSTSAASESGAHSYVEMLLRLSSVQVSLYPRLTVRGVITAGRAIYGGGSSCPLMLVSDPPTCRLSLSFKIFISIFTASAILVTPSLCSFC